MRETFKMQIDRIRSTAYELPAKERREPIKWAGEHKVCQICKRSIVGKSFVDGATHFGPWALMCVPCSILHGFGLGTGKGQKYNKDGVKIDG